MFSIPRKVKSVPLAIRDSRNETVQPWIFSKRRMHGQFCSIKTAIFEIPASGRFSLPSGKKPLPSGQNQPQDTVFQCPIFDAAERSA